MTLITYAYDLGGDLIAARNAGGAAVLYGSK